MKNRVADLEEALKEQSKVVAYLKEWHEASLALASELSLKGAVDRQLTPAEDKFVQATIMFSVVAMSAKLGPKS